MSPYGADIYRMIRGDLVDIVPIWEPAFRKIVGHPFVEWRFAHRHRDDPFASRRIVNHICDTSENVVD